MILTTFTKQFETFPEPDIKENTIRIRIRDPNLFEKDSFKTIRLTSGVQAIIGRKEGETKTSVQSLIFDKKKFDLTKAKQWAKQHKTKFSQAISFEKQKRQLFSEVTESYKKYVVNRIDEINKILNKNLR